MYEFAREPAVLWHGFKERCENVYLFENWDRCKWLLNSSGVFSVDSLYVALKANQIRSPFKKLWSIKVLFLIKVFVWLLFRNSNLTSDNVLKRGW
jgi:hypothetical protein